MKINRADSGNLSHAFNEKMSKVEKRSIKAKKIAEEIISVIKTPDWRNNPVSYNKLSRLYRKYEEKTASKKVRKNCKETSREIKESLSQFKTKKMPEMVKSIEKHSGIHVNGTQAVKVISKGVSSGKALKKLPKVSYFDKKTRLKYLASFTNDGKIVLPKDLKGEKKVIYVVDRFGQFFVAKDASKVDGGLIKHSSFLGGRAVAGCGTLSFSKDGKIKKIDDDSGHYCPGKPELTNAITALGRHGVSLDTFEVHQKGQRPEVASKWLQV